ncbi:dCTP deaminase domain-containing protein [Aliarcobacter butzleri]|uniref:dCTP deaminase domain-containing protein n=1 Tax=Aliarcobacter butzleri TaxID=28197 RepID=UPI0021B2B71D|nr:hypothetical protein [Aliarcobacter butzleri]MCT7594870.1 hypothetical protein [Aliarcobacter butzleri]MCT7599329.1 hypothetical protein [Aliarcobacter butzleri]
MHNQNVSSEYNQHKYNDPFDTIDNALLNVYHIKQYIETCKILEPFEENNLKSATYKVPLYGQIYTWNENTNIIEKIDLQRDGTNQEIILKPNSITYVYIDTIFRVPYYMAFRFNLTVSLAHKGLLLGTGPIIDPGFEGRIMIPIHNLTANTYKLEAGSGLIRVEFTKLSKLEIPDINNFQYQFPENNTYMSALKYFEDINDSKPIFSSIPLSLNKATESAKEAANSAQYAKDKIKQIAIISILGIFIGVILPVFSLINDLNSLMIEKTEKIEELKYQISEQKTLVEELKNQINEQKSSTTQLKKLFNSKINTFPVNVKKTDCIENVSHK